MNLSRKQREIANRHALFLEIAEGILAEEGRHGIPTLHLQRRNPYPTVY